MTIDEQIDRELEILEDANQRACFHSANSIPSNFGKYSGQIRASVRMNINSYDLSVTLAPVYKKDAIVGEIEERERSFLATSKRVKIGDVVHISDNIPYVENAEYQYGNYAFRKAIASWPRHVDQGQREARAAV